MSSCATAVSSAPGVGETQLLAPVLHTTQGKPPLSDLEGVCMLSIHFETPICLDAILYV